MRRLEACGTERLCGSAWPLTGCTAALVRLAIRETFSDSERASWPVRGLDGLIVALDSSSVGFPSERRAKNIENTLYHLRLKDAGPGGSPGARMLGESLAIGFL